MDTFTHALMGMAAGEAVFRRRLGRGTLFTAAVASAMPDFDLLSSLSGNPFVSLAWHRAETHSLLLTALAAPLLGWLAARLYSKGNDVRLWSLLVLLCLWLHILLDLCTSWGTEALSPFLKTRYAWDFLPVVDPLFSVPLLLAAILTIPGSYSSFAKISRTCAIAALVWCVGYTVAGGMMNRQAIALARPALTERHAPADLRAIPAFGTVFLWNVIARYSDGSAATVPVSTWKHQRVGTVTQYPACASPLCDTAARSLIGRLLQRTSGGYVHYRKLPDTDTLVVHDLRYSGFTLPESAESSGTTSKEESESIFRYRVVFPHSQAPVFRQDSGPVLQRKREDFLAIIFQLAFRPLPEYAQQAPNGTQSK